MKTARRLAFATALLTIVLIAIGAYVRATGSGLGCPDWPTCHGGVVPPGSRHSLIEFSHRFVASLVGLMVIATAVLAWRHYRHVPFTLWTATAAVPLVGLQGILGAITVKRELPPEVVATHLLAAMLVLTCELAVALSMYREELRQQAGRNAEAVAGLAVGKLSLLALAWLAGVLWMGGYMAESGASTACSGWPACNGSLLPTSDNQEITHMVHRYLAGTLAIFIVAVVVAGWRQRKKLAWAGPVAIAAGALYVAQVVVGAANVWYTFPDWLTVAHTAIAASVWATLSSAVILAFYAPATVRVMAHVDGRAGVAA
jgi:heme A synthase